MMVNPLKYTQDSLQFLKWNYAVNYAYLAEDENSDTSKVLLSGNLVENCDRLGNWDLCSASKENNGNSKHHMNGLEIPSI